MISRPDLETALSLAALVAYGVVWGLGVLRDPRP